MKKRNISLLKLLCSVSMSACMMAQVALPTLAFEEDEVVEVENTSVDEAVNEEAEEDIYIDESVENEIMDEEAKENSKEEEISEEEIEEDAVEDEKEDASNADWEYSVTDGTVTITAYKGNSLNLVIPSQISGKAVTSIGDHAFANLNITSISIPASIQNIGEGAFENCLYVTSIYYDAVNANCVEGSFENCGMNSTGIAFRTGINVSVIPANLFNVSNFNEYAKLTSIVITSNVHTISDYAFIWCKELSSLTLSEGIKSIGSQAFGYCDVLTSITIPSTVESLGMCAFGNISNLQEINYNAKNIKAVLTPFWVSGSVCGAINLTFGSEVTIIPNLFDRSLMENKYIKSLYIPSNVKKISPNAFVGCSNLTSVTLSEGLEEIGSYAFKSCESLQAITIPSTVNSLGFYTFDQCSNLVDFTCKSKGVSYSSTASIISGNDTCVVKCYKGSTTETFAKQKGYSVVYLDTITGWQKEDGNWYFYNESGKKSTGWIKDNGNWYYLADDGIMRTYWQKVNSIWYYLGGNGRMCTYWQQINGNWYYFGGNGRMVVGWQQINGTWYYFDSHGIMVKGWSKIGDTWYYFDEHGATCYNWQLINNQWYYFGSNGKMVIGWQHINNVWYYFDSHGAMAKGWLQINGSWYYFDSSGAMKTGWLQLGSTWYYLDEHGVMVTGMKIIDGKENYFDASGKWLYSKHQGAHTHNYKYYKTDTTETFDHVRTKTIVYAYDEPIYETKNLYICNQCNTAFYSGDEAWDHIENSMTTVYDAWLRGEIDCEYKDLGNYMCGGWHSGIETKRVGTKHHDAVVEYYNVYNVYYEFYYKCEVCGDIILYNTANSTREQKVE